MQHVFETNERLEPIFSRRENGAKTSDLTCCFFALEMPKLISVWKEERGRDGERGMLGYNVRKTARVREREE